MRFTLSLNPIWLEDEQLKNGCSVVVNPFGDIIDECRKPGDENVIAECVHEKIDMSDGYRYRNVRKPKLYAEIPGRENVSN